MRHVQPASRTQQCTLEATRVPAYICLSYEMPKVYIDSNPLTAHERVFIDSNWRTAHENAYVVDSPLLADKRVYVDSNPLTAHRRVFIVTNPLIADHLPGGGLPGSAAVGGYSRPLHLRWYGDRRLIPSLLNAAVVILGIGLGSSLVAGVWAATTFQRSDEGYHYGAGLHLLLRVAAITCVPALAASWTYTVAARLRRERTSAFFRDHSQALLVAAGVLPPALVGLIGAFRDHMWVWAGGTTYGPPRWFWLLGPLSLALTHVLVLAVHAQRLAPRPSSRRLYSLAVIAAAVVAFFVVAPAADWGIG